MAAAIGTPKAILFASSCAPKIEHRSTTGVAYEAIFIASMAALSSSCSSEAMPGAKSWIIGSGEYADAATKHRHGISKKTVTILMIYLISFGLLARASVGTKTPAIPPLTVKVITRSGMDIISIATSDDVDDPNV